MIIWQHATVHVNICSENSVPLLSASWASGERISFAVEELRPHLELSLSTDGGRICAEQKDYPVAITLIQTKTKFYILSTSPSQSRILKHSGITKPREDTSISNSSDLTDTE